MRHRRLGGSDLEVSELCLGTMTFGEQNSEAEGHEQLDYALAQGINFIDTAEVYSIPPRPETAGRTEEIIGSWLARRGRRDDVIIATKVAGRSKLDWLRAPMTRLTREQIHSAIEGSLRRLRTDYVDLYQLHWPDRPLRLFGGLGYRHIDDSDSVPVIETLVALGELVRAGKVRHIGLSNETSWGLAQFLAAAVIAGLPRVVTVQNAYNLLNRTYELGLSEFWFREQVGLLAYSPLGQGTLTGKYLDGAAPPGSRKVLFQRHERYETPGAEAATRGYVALAQAHHLDPSQLALAFVRQQPFVTSTIIGATSMAQLRTAIGSAALTLDDELLKAIHTLHVQQPNPCP